MEQLFVAAAKLMPEGDLLNELTRALENYKTLHTEESKHKLMMFMMLLSTRWGTASQSLSETLTSFDETKKTLNLFKNKEQ